MIQNILYNKCNVWLIVIHCSVHFNEFFFLDSDGANSQIKLSKWCFFSYHVSPTAWFLLRLTLCHYLIFIIWSSWFPLLMYISLGYNRKLENRITTISTELVPLSTKSPLNTYGLSVEGRPFWKQGNWVIAHFCKTHIEHTWMCIDSLLKRDNFENKELVSLSWRENYVYMIVHITGKVLILNGKASN